MQRHPAPQARPQPRHHARGKHREDDSQRALREQRQCRERWAGGEDAAPQQISLRTAPSVSLKKAPQASSQAEQTPTLVEDSGFVGFTPSAVKRNGTQSVVITDPPASPDPVTIPVASLLEPSRVAPAVSASVLQPTVVGRAAIGAQPVAYRATISRQAAVHPSRTVARAPVAGTPARRTAVSRIGDGLPGVNLVPTASDADAPALVALVGLLLVLAGARGVARFRRPADNPDLSWD